MARSLHNTNYGVFAFVAALMLFGFFRQKLQGATPRNGMFAPG